MYFSFVLMEREDKKQTNISHLIQSEMLGKKVKRKKYQTVWVMRLHFLKQHHTKHGSFGSIKVKAMGVQKVDYVSETGNVDLVTDNPQWVQISSKGSFSSNGKSPAFPTGILRNSDRIENKMASTLVLLQLQGMCLQKLYHPALRSFLVGLNKKRLKFYSLHMGMNKCSILLLQVSQKQVSGSKKILCDIYLKG